jgi:hypothetical protein
MSRRELRSLRKLLAFPTRHSTIFFVKSWQLAGFLACFFAGDGV